MIGRLILILLFIFKLLSAQTIGEWQNFTNKKEIRKISRDGEIVWAASSGGIFSTDFFSYNNLLTKSEGLSSQNITAIARDDQNRIWLGTDNGIVNIYYINTDEIKKIFDINRTENTRKAINSIDIHNGRAYISIDFGLSVIDTETLEFVETVLKFGDFPSNSIVNNIFIGEKIYVNTENGLAIQKSNAVNLANPESWQTTLVGINDGNIPAGNVYCSTVYNDRLFVGTDQGLLALVENRWLNISDDTIPVKDIKTEQDVLYILKTNSLYSYNNESMEMIFADDNNEFNHLAIKNGSTFYIASLNGIVEYSSGDITYHYPNGPSTNDFISIAMDDNSNLWAATGKNGLGKGFMKFDQEIWIDFSKTTDTNIITDDYHKVFSYDSKVLLASWGKGFSIVYNDNLSNYNASNTELEGISDDHSYVVIQDLKLDNSGYLWAFNHWPYNNNCLFMLDENDNEYSFRFPFFSLSESMFLDNGEIDDFNTKWFSIHNNGLFYFNENGTLNDKSDDIWGELGQTEYFNGRDITCLAVDNRNELWVGTSLGIKIIPNPSSPKSQMLSVFPLRQQSINCIAVDPLNQKWVGTSQGLFHVSSDGSSLINQYDSKNSPLPADNIQSLAIDKNTGTVYAGTSLGLSSVTTTSAEPNEDYSELFVYPNPLIIGGSSNNFVQIDGLVENSSIKILSLSGKLINEYETAGGRIDFWDGKDMDGKFVSSGIYLIVAYDQEADKVKSTKIAVIRK